MIKQNGEEVKVLLSVKELELLIDLLGDHLYWGWIEGDGEFGVVASNRVSPTLQRLYRRLNAIAKGGA